MDNKSRIPCASRFQPSQLSAQQKKITHSAAPTSYLSARKLSQGTDSGLLLGVRGFRPSVTSSFQPSSVNRKSIFSGQKPSLTFSSNRKTTVKPGFSFTPQQLRPSLNFGTASSSRSARKSSIIGDRRYIKDNRPLNDRNYHQQCITKVIEFLTENGYRFPITKTFLRSMTSLEIMHVFEFLFSFLDPKLKVIPIEIEVPKLLKLLGYPFQINKSSIVSAASNSARGQLLGAFEWLVDVVNYSLKVKPEQILLPPNFEEINPKREILRFCLNNISELEKDPERVREFNILMAQNKFGKEESIDELIEEQEALEKEVIRINEEIEEQKKIPAILREYEEGARKMEEYNQQMIEHIKLKRENLDEISKTTENKETEIKALEAKLDGVLSELRQQKFDMNDLKWAKDRQKQVESLLNEAKGEIEDVKKEIRTMELELKRKEDGLRKSMADMNSCFNALKEIFTASSMHSYVEPIVKFVETCEWTKIMASLSEPGLKSKAGEDRAQLASIAHKLKSLIDELVTSLQVNVLLTDQQNMHDIDLKIEEMKTIIKAQEEEKQRLSAELNELRESQKREWKLLKEECNEKQNEVKMKEIKIRRLEEELNEKLQKLKRDYENKVKLYDEEAELASRNLKAFLDSIAAKVHATTNTLNALMNEHIKNSEKTSATMQSNERDLQKFIDRKTRKSKKNSKK